MAPERPMSDQARETLDVDVLFVGGGPAGLAGAIRLKQLLRARNESAARAGRPPLDLSIALIEKGREIGSLGRLVRWLAQRAEQEGVDLFPGFAAVEPLLDGERLIGVRTGDRGIDR